MPGRDLFFDVWTAMLVAGVTAAAVWWMFDPAIPGLFAPEERWVLVSPLGFDTSGYTSVTKTPPTSLYFPTLGKRVAVSAGRVRGNTWDLYDDKAAWLSTSAIAGEGNTIVYAHNFPELFGGLDRLEVGALIETSQGGETLVFRVSESREISPTDVDAILSEKIRLTLYTCDGSFDQKRRVVYADLVPA